MDHHQGIFRSTTQQVTAGQMSLPLEDLLQIGTWAVQLIRAPESCTSLGGSACQLVSTVTISPRMRSQTFLQALHLICLHMDPLLQAMEIYMYLEEMIDLLVHSAHQLTFSTSLQLAGRMVPICHKLLRCSDMQQMAIDSMWLEGLVALIFRTRWSMIFQQVCGARIMAHYSLEEFNQMLLFSWMVVYIPLGDRIALVLFQLIWLLLSVECITSVDTAMMKTNALSMTPARAMDNVLEARMSPALHHPIHVRAQFVIRPSRVTCQQARPAMSQTNVL